MSVRDQLREQESERILAREDRAELRDAPWGRVKVNMHSYFWCCQTCGRTKASNSGDMYVAPWCCGRGMGFVRADGRQR